MPERASPDDESSGRAASSKAPTPGPSMNPRTERYVKERERNRRALVGCVLHRVIARGSVEHSAATSRVERQRAMDVQCERCKAEYDFDDALVSGRGTTVKCTGCGHQFKIRRGSERPDEAAPDRWLVRTTEGRELVFTSLRELAEGDPREEGGARRCARARRRTRARTRADLGAGVVLRRSVRGFGRTRAAPRARDGAPATKTMAQLLGPRPEARCRRMVSSRPPPPKASHECGAGAPRHRIDAVRRHRSHIRGTTRCAPASTRFVLPQRPQRSPRPARGPGSARSLRSRRTARAGIASSRNEALRSRWRPCSRPETSRAFQRRCRCRSAHRASSPSMTGITEHTPPMPVHMHSSQPPTVAGRARFAARPQGSQSVLRRWTGSISAPPVDDEHVPPAASHDSTATPNRRDRRPLSRRQPSP